MKLKNTKVKNFFNNKVIPQDLTTINSFLVSLLRIFVFENLLNRIKIF